MELQTSLIEESPIVTLKNGTQYARRTMNTVMHHIRQMQTEIPNGALLLNDLVTKCRDADYEYYPGCQWKLSELDLLDSDGQVKPSVRDIVLSAVIGEGMDIGFASPIRT
jgi:hypothetical protein